MNQRIKFIAEEICGALACDNVPNLDAVDKTLDHLTSRNGALVAPLAHHQQEAMAPHERRVNKNLRKLVIIGSLLAENFRQLNAATGGTLSDGLADAWELQLAEFRNEFRDGGIGHGHH